MIGNKIVVTAEPKGVFQPVIVSGTPSPGTHAEIVAGTNANASGLFTFKARALADGVKGPIAVFVEDDEQGKTVNDAYVSGKVGKIYWPVAGEIVNVLRKYQPGTGTANADNVGDKLEIDQTGKVQAIGIDGGAATHVSAPWCLVEDITTAVSADDLIACQYLGNQA